MRSRQFVLSNGSYAHCPRAPVQSQLLSGSLVFRQRFSVKKSRVKNLGIAIRGSGSIQVEFRPPLHTTPKQNKALIFLPSRCSWHGENPSPSKVQEAAALLSNILPSCSVFTLSYRLKAPEHIFPLPIHDVFIAFETIRERLLLKNKVVPQISLLGSEIGGTLATALALTSPNVIHSLAVSEPVFDWVALDDGMDEFFDENVNDLSTANLEMLESPLRKTRARKHALSDVEPLLNLRSRIFPKPETCFDPFASPTLFLRAPGRDCPPHNQDLTTTTQFPDSDAYGPYDDDISAETSQSGMESGLIARPIKRRKVLRHWPADEDPNNVKLPVFRVFASDDQHGPGMVLRGQAEEMVGLMKRVCLEGVAREAADERVGVEIGPRKGTGSLSGLKVLGIEKAATWIAKEMGRVS